MGTICQSRANKTNESTHCKPQNAQNGQNTQNGQNAQNGLKLTNLKEQNKAQNPQNPQSRLLNYKIMIFGKNKNELAPESEWNFNNIISIHLGKKYVIYSNNKVSQIWCAGDNMHGSCANHKLYPLQYCTKMKYFNKRSIKIHKICVNVSGESTFWIDYNNNVYANGYNDHGQLGLYDKNQRNVPQLIPPIMLNNVSDIKSSHLYSIALCRTENKYNANIIIECWSNRLINKDIINLIVKYYYLNAIYWTDNCEWRKIDFFENKEIVKIECGHKYSLFLDCNGKIWQSSTKRIISEIEPIRSFIRSKIKIMDIVCGGQHSLSFDCNYNVYSWGNNNYGQCGDGTDNKYNKMYDPKQIIYLKNYKINQIKCGYYHSYCKTIDGDHFLFGSNTFNQCLSFDGNEKIKVPLCINKFIEDVPKKKIKSISLGYQQTTIILSISEISLSRHSSCSF